ncbi:MAG: hypothetical protein WAS33_05350 [Candidatus Promineifilaceae bacterium]|nr:hypothetical protein [Anaerolineaceae bacterium]
MELGHRVPLYLSTDYADYADFDCFAVDLQVVQILILSERKFVILPQFADRRGILGDNFNVARFGEGGNKWMPACAGMTRDGD